MMMIAKPTTAATLRGLVTSRCAPLCEVLAVMCAGLGIVGCSIAIFGNSLWVSIPAVWAANVVMMALAYLGLRIRGQDWSHFGLTFAPGGAVSLGRTFLQSLVVFIIAVAAFVCGAILMANLVGTTEPADFGKYNGLRGNLGLTVISLLSVYVVSSFAEEVIYRGFMITRLGELISSERASRLFPVLASGCVFGAVHSDWGIVGMVQASCMGIALGASYLVVRRNLWVTILAHAYMDTILVLQMYFAGT